MKSFSAAPSEPSEPSEPSWRNEPTHQTPLENHLTYLSVLLHTQTLDVHLHSLEHFLSVSVHIDDLLLQGRHLGDEVQTALSLLLLELQGNSTHRSSLDSLHQMLCNQ